MSIGATSAMSLYSGQYDQPIIQKELQKAALQGCNFQIQQQNEAAERSKEYFQDALNISN